MVHSIWHHAVLWEHRVWHIHVPSFVYVRAVLIYTTCTQCRWGVFTARLLQCNALLVCRHGLSAINSARWRSHRRTLSRGHLQAPSFRERPTPSCDNFTWTNNNFDQGKHQYRPRDTTFCFCSLDWSAYRVISYYQWPHAHAVANINKPIYNFNKAVSVSVADLYEFRLVFLMP